MTEDADGAITWNDYDRNGNLVRQIMPVEYAAYGRDGAGYRSTMISPEGIRQLFHRMAADCGSRNTMNTVRK